MTSNVRHPVTVVAMELVVHPSPADVAAAAAERINRLTVSGANLGLAGGSTPAATYAAMLELGRDWSQVEFWLSDERWVPPDHDRSNGRGAVEQLTGHFAGKLHRPVWGEDAEISARDYEMTLGEVWGDERPDVVLLGMGDDGHTASLFPGTTALAERERRFVANYVDSQEEMRLTATYPLLWAARHVIFLVVGKGKAEALRDSFEGRTPAGRVGEGDAQVEWHVDETAASLIS